MFFKERVMRIFSFRFFLLNLFLLFSVNLCLATVNFGSRDSKINVLAGARLNVGSGNLSIDGTLSQETGGLVTGNSFSFDNGVLEQGAAESLLNGTFNPSATEVLQFTGNGVLRGEPGSLIYGVLISGLNNIISGQPTFVLPISLLNGSSEVVLDLQEALSQSLSLNGGRAVLKGDLALCDDVKIVGPGTVDLNNRQLSLGGAYKEHWSDDIVFERAASLVLTGSVSLDASWYFNSDSNISGNGAILDLSNNGKIVVGANTALYLEDIVIKGLGDTLGKIIFTSNTSKLYMSKVELALGSNYTITLGQIVVDGTSLFNHGPYQFNINTAANLTVDGVTLWLEPLSIEGAGGGNLNVSRPIYTSGSYSTTNVAANIADGTLTFLNDAIIKRAVQSSGGGNVDPAEQQLISGSVDTDVTMNYFIFLPANASMNFTGTAGVTLNGNGSVITFADVDFPQFIVQPGVTITLQDITLNNINNQTFQIFPGGRINIGDNVTFGFGEDVTFTAPAFNVLTGGSLTLVGAEGSTVLTLYDPVNPTSPILNIGNSTLTLANMSLTGIGHIIYGPDNLIALTGDAGANIDVNNGLNFKADGHDNNLTFIEDAITLSGLVVFGDKAVNELHVRFALINGLTAERIAAMERYPLLAISGGPGFIIGGVTGSSRLIFDDPYVVINLLDSNSIQLDTNAHLQYEELEVRTYPIKQLSSRVLDDGVQMHGLKIDNSFIRARLNRQNASINAAKNSVLKQVALDQDIQEILGQDSELVTDLRGISSEHINGFAEKDPLKIRKELLKMERAKLLDAGMTRSKGRYTPRSEVVEPASYDQQYSGQYVNSSEPFFGNIEMRNSQFDNFSVDPFLDLGLYMKQGSQILQGMADVSFVRNKHTVNIIGRDNKISVQREMHFSNNLLIDKNSSVEFNFVPTGYENPTLVFDAGSVIQVSENSTLIFSGNGKVVLSEGVIIHLLATEDSKTKEISNKSTLILTDGAVLDFADGANSKIDGIGNIIVQRAAAIRPSNAGSLVIGSSITDEISLNVTDNAQICLENPYINGISRISLQKMVTNLNFEKGGMLIVGANSIFELNVLNGAIANGVVTALSFGDNGFLVVKDNGYFRFAENRSETGSQKNYDFSWVGFLSNIRGGGYVEYKNISASKSFTGQVVGTSPELFTDVSNMTFEHLAYLLVDQLPVELADSIWYIKPNGLGVVITKNNVKVNLIAGDIIDREDEKGNIYGINNDKEFKITANGVRS